MFILCKKSFLTPLLNFFRAFSPICDVHSCFIPIVRVHQSCALYSTASLISKNELIHKRCISPIVVQKLLYQPYISKKAGANKLAVSAILNEGVVVGNILLM